MLKKFILGEKGQSMVIFAFSIMALIGFAGFAIDGGRMYMVKSQLQKAVDAGALAGGQELLEAIKIGGPSSVNYTTISTTVNGVAEKNYLDGSYSYDPDKHGTEAVEVQGEESVNLLLMPVLGINNSTVKAVARVKIGNVSKVPEKIVIPVGVGFNKIEDLVFGSIVNITEGPGDGDHGFYSFLNFGPLTDPPKSNGADTLREYLKSGSPVPIEIGDQIQLATGLASGPVEQGIAPRKNTIVYVPILEFQYNYDKNGNKISINHTNPATVVGFAVFRLIDYVKETEGKGSEKTETHVIKAEFIRTELEGDVGDGIEDYGAYNAKLEL